MALTCSLNRNILRTSSCGYSLLEINDIYLATYENFNTAIGEDVDYSGCTNEAVTAITTASTDPHFYHIVPAKNSVQFTDELVVEDSGSKYRTHTLTFNISNKYDACLHIDFDNLSLGRYLGVVKTADGSYLMLGRLTGLEASAASLNGGGDTNGMSVTLSCNVAESAMPLSAAAVTQMLGFVPAE